MVGVMLLAFGGVILAHMLVVRTLQARLASGGAPRLGKVAERQGLLRNWLVAAGVAVVVATLSVAGLTNLFLR